MTLIIIVILIAITAICKAIADTLADHFDVSIFSTWKNRQFWDKSISWLNKYQDGDPKKGLKKIPIKIFGKVFNVTVFTPLTDAWHLVNSIQICTFLLLPFFIVGFKYKLIFYVCFGIFYNIVFNVCYNHILRK